MVRNRTEKALPPGGGGLGGGAPEMSMRLYLLQRASAAILAPLVLVHLALIAYAVQGGLSAAEILARTRGSAGWAVFYGLFVATVAVHGSIGLRTILIDRRWVFKEEVHDPAVRLRGAADQRGQRTTS